MIKNGVGSTVESTQKKIEREARTGQPSHCVSVFDSHTYIDNNDNQKRAITHKMREKQRNGSKYRCEGKIQRNIYIYKKYIYI